MKPIPLVAASMLVAALAITAAAQRPGSTSAKATADKAGYTYATPPAFKPTLTGHFFVPFPPDGTSPEEIEQRLASNSYHSIPTITAT